MENSDSKQTPSSGRDGDSLHGVEDRPVHREGRIMRWLLPVCWAVLVYCVLQYLDELSLVPALICIFLTSTPIAVNGVYLTSIAQCRRLTMFSNKGVLYVILSGRWIRIVLWSLWAALTGLFMVLEFRTHTRTEWFAVALVIPAFAFVFLIARRLLSRELKPYLVIRGAILTAQRLTPWIMLIVYVVVLRHFETFTEWDSVREAIDEAKAHNGQIHGSALLSEASEWMGYFCGVKTYVLGRASSFDDWVSVGILAAGKFVIFFNVCAILSCFAIPGREFKRAFARPTDEDEPGPVSRAGQRLLFLWQWCHGQCCCIMHCRLRHGCVKPRFSPSSVHGSNRTSRLWWRPLTRSCFEKELSQKSRHFVQRRSPG